MRAFEQGRALALWIAIGCGACGGKVRALEQASADESGSMPSGARAQPGEERCGKLIDDLERGTGQICSGEGRVGVWYVFNDGSGVQWPAPTPPGTPVETSQIPSGRSESKRAMHTSGSGFQEWGAGLGLDLAHDGVSYGRYDAHEYDGIRFWARSDQPMQLVVRVGSAPTVVAEFGGACPMEPCAPHAGTFLVGQQWTEFNLPFNDLLQFGYYNQPADLLRDQLINLQFMPLDALAFDYWIDDVRFYRDRDCCAELPDSCGDEIEFPAPALEARVRRSLGKKEGDIECEDICNVSPLLALPLNEAALLPPIGELSGLQCLVALTSLNLNQSDVSEFSLLSSLTELTALSLDQSGISDLEPFSGLTKLTAFSANDAQITDLRPLAQLPALKSLTIANNPLDDLTQLLEFPALEFVDLRGSPQACSDVESEVVLELTQRSVGVSYGPTTVCPMAVAVE